MCVYLEWKFPILRIKKKLCGFYNNNNNNGTLNISGKNCANDRPGKCRILNMCIMGEYCHLVYMWCYYISPFPFVVPPNTVCVSSPFGTVFRCVNVFKVFFSCSKIKTFFSRSEIKPNFFSCQEEKSCFMKTLNLV